LDYDYKVIMGGREKDYMPPNPPKALCLSGDTLGKGTLRMYPSWRVPIHPFRVLGLKALGRSLGEFSMCE
jgi:hypothetical protein